MKKLVSFRTDAENKALLISKARELELPLSEYLDQITEQFHLEIKNESKKDNGILNMAKRSLFLSSQVRKMLELIRRNNSEKTETKNNDELLQNLIALIEETFKKNQEMRSEDILQE